MVDEHMLYLLYIYGAYVGIMVVTGLDMVGVFVVPACSVPFTRDCRTMIFSAFLRTLRIV